MASTAKFSRNSFCHLDFSPAGFPMLLEASHPKEVQWNDHWVYQYEISVIRNGHAAKFKYHTSRNDYQNGTHLQPKDLPFALYCFVSDGISGQMSIDDFCSEFGYTASKEMPISKINSIYRACRKSFRDLENLGFSENDLYEIMNATNE